MGKKWFFEKIDKNDKQLARWNKVKQPIHPLPISSDRGAWTTEPPAPAAAEVGTSDASALSDLSETDD